MRDRLQLISRAACTRIPINHVSCRACGCAYFQGIYIVRNFTLNSERFPTYTPEMKYNVTIQYLFAPDKRKPNELVEMVKIYVLGKMDSTNDVKRRRQALGRRTKKLGKHWNRVMNCLVCGWCANHYEYVKRKYFLRIKRDSQSRNISSAFCGIFFRFQFKSRRNHL